MLNHSLSTIYYILVSSGMSFGLVPLMYKVGMILDITDKPGGRHLHKTATPRTGGIAIYITFVATLNLVTNPPIEFQGLFFASSVIALLGIVDDIKRLPAELKLLGQIIATVILIRHGIFFSFIPNHFWGFSLTIILTIIWVVGITNAFNFLDGLDGLSSGIAIIVLIFYALIAHSISDTFMMLVSIILLGSILG
ncbi:MAG: undecaprenyl/decaprenyl-phosphate alpha-N-acetylglucosaminyl 1-phosphate transferase, partial [Candidatus Neomarinimicrobiota bacterium]